EYRLAETERTPSDLGLQVRRNRDGDRGNGAILDQRPPISKPARDAGCPRQLGRARSVGARQRLYRAAWVGAERWQQHGAPIVEPDDSYSDHGESLRGRSSSGRCRPCHACSPVAGGLAGRDAADTTSRARTENAGIENRTNGPKWARVRPADRRSSGRK